MATPIQMWKSQDGKTFPSRGEADAHDDATMLLRRFSLNHASPYTVLTTILERHSLVPRVYPSEAK